MLIGYWYHVFVIETEPEDAGHAGVGRPRLYILCLHKTKGREQREIKGKGAGESNRGKVKTMKTCLAHFRIQTGKALTG